jgi:hypothetical protein
MRTHEWKAAIALLCGLGACVAGFGGLALRLSPRATVAPVVAVEADEDECEEPAPDLAAVDVEA